MTQRNDIYAVGDSTLPGSYGCFGAVDTTVGGWTLVPQERILGKVRDKPHIIPKQRIGDRYLWACISLPPQAAGLATLSLYHKAHDRIQAYNSKILANRQNSS